MLAPINPRGSNAKPGFRGVAVEVLGVCRARWRTLLLAGLLVFVPLGLVDVLNEHLQESLSELGEDPDAGTAVAALLGAFGQSAASLIGEVIYAGLIAFVVVAHRRGERGRSLGELIRALPFKTLAAVDLLSALVIAVGFLLLLVPGFILLAWFALVAPAVKLERLGVFDAMRRSRELVRPRFWLVLGLLLPILLIEDLLGAAAQSASWWGLGDGFAGDWFGSVLANLITSPFYAVAVVILFLDLSEAAGQRNSAQTASVKSR